MSKHRSAFFVFLFSLLAIPAGAQTQGISFQAVIQPPLGDNPTEENLTAKLLVLAPSTTGVHCVLRSEDHTGVDIKNGYLNLVLGGPSGNAQADGFNPASILSLAEALDNATVRTGLRCVDADNQIVLSGQTYIPSAGDKRLLRLAVEIGTDVVVADFNLRSVPYAMNAQTLDGKAPSSFIQSKTATKVTQSHLDQFFSTITAASGNSIRWNGTAFVVFDPSSGGNLAAGSVPNSALAPVDWSKLANVPAGVSQLAGLSCATGKILKKGASAWVCADESTPTESDPTVRNFAKNDPGAGLTVVSNALRVDFSTGSTSGKAVEANDPRLTNARAPTPHPHSFNDLQSTSGGYLSYRPNNQACSIGQVLKWDGTKWLCDDDIVGSGEGGGSGTEVDPTVALFAKRPPGAGLLVDGTNTLTLDFGTASTNAVRGDDVRLSDARAPTAHTHPVSEILSGANAFFTYKPNNAPCSDGNVLKWNAADERWECGTDLNTGGGGGGGGEGGAELPPGTSGQFMKYSGGAWGGYSLAESDVPGLTTKLSGFTTDISGLQTTVGGLSSQLGGMVRYNQLPSLPCTAYQTLAYASPTDTWTCADIDYSEARLPAATGTAGGIVTASAQNLGGVKTFVENAIFSKDVQIGDNALVGANLTVSGGLNVTDIASVGGLKIGLAPGLPCNGTTAGVLRYNDGIEFCDGSSWVGMGGDEGGGSGGGGGGPDDHPLGNVCALFPPLGMPCPDGSYYSGVFRYAQRDHKRTTVAPPGCTLDDPEAEDPDVVCDEDEEDAVDTLQIPWVRVEDPPPILCGAASAKNGAENRANLQLSPCFEGLGAPLFCMGTDLAGDDTFYLPSIEELKHLFKNREEIGGFASGVYWSSTESTSPGKAMAIEFTGTTANVVEKDMTEFAYVRCMRQHDPAE